MSYETNLYENKVTYITVYDSIYTISVNDGHGNQMIENWVDLLQYLRYMCKVSYNIYVAFDG